VCRLDLGPSTDGTTDYVYGLDGIPFGKKARTNFIVDFIMLADERAAKARRN